MAKKKVAKKKGVRKKAPRKKAAGSGSGKTAPAEAGRPLELKFVRAGELKDHPENWRVHPASQVKAFEAVRREVGFVGYVVVNRRTGHVLDGHMRKNAVPAETLVPVVFGDWSEAEERLVLATFNPLGDMAGLDAGKAEGLLARVASSEPAVQALLEVLERDIEKAMRAVDRAAAKDEEQDEDEQPEAGDGGGADEGAGKAVKQIHAVMIRCADELDQMTLIQELKGRGFKQVKRAGLE
jgi:hypothetical protein